MQESPKVTRVDFAFGVQNRLHSACHVVRKQYLAQQRLIVYCSDAVRLGEFDRLLWVFHDASFIPHVLASDTLAPHTPIILSAALPLTASLISEEISQFWLLNLDDACPPEPEQFNRLLEIVSNDSLDREAARQRWRTYQANGHQVIAHNIGQHSSKASN